MFGGKLGVPELLLILVIALIFFGPSKLGDLGKGLGDAIRNFKGSMRKANSRHSLRLPLRTRSNSSPGSDKSVCPQHLPHKGQRQSYYIRVVAFQAHVPLRRAALYGVAAGFVPRLCAGRIVLDCFLL
jgi:sec-independent protein translocase protein TatA